MKSQHNFGCYKEVDEGMKNEHLSLFYCAFWVILLESPGSFPKSIPRYAGKPSALNPKVAVNH